MRFRDTPDVLTAEFLMENMMELMRDIDEAEHQGRARVHIEADAEEAYRKARHEVHQDAECQALKTVDQQKAMVDAKTAGLRKARDRAAGDAKVALQRIYNLRTALSSFQTITNLAREQAAYERTAPSINPAADERARGGRY